MAKRKVTWSSTSKQSLKEILSFYNEATGNQKYSRTLNKHLRKMVSYIKSNNYIGKESEVENLRVLIYKHYEIFYKVFDNEVRIIVIWDSRRNPKDLEKLFKK